MSGLRWVAVVTSTSILPSRSSHCKQTKTSPWFGFDTSDEEQSTPRCKICLKSVAVKSSMTNLFQHLQNNHPSEWQQCVAERTAQGNANAATPPPTPKQVTLPTSFSCGVPYDKIERGWKNITDAVTFHIATEMVPTYTAEKAGFQHLLLTLDLCYKLPGRKHFGEVVLPRPYNTNCAKVTKKLEDVLFFFAVTDLWSSTMQPYLSLTVHFITDDFFFFF